LLKMSIMIHPCSSTNRHRMVEEVEEEEVEVGGITAEDQEGLRMLAEDMAEVEVEGAEEVPP